MKYGCERRDPPDLFRIEIPLPESPSRYLNSYAIKSPERNLVIDTGLKRPECLEAMISGLNKIGIDLADTDFDIQIVVCPIVREKDGLAMSSRNTYLTKDQRMKSPVL